MAMTLIATHTVTSATGSFTFSSIPQTYETLLIKGCLADSISGTGRNDFTITFNSDNTNGANYYGNRWLFYDGNNRLHELNGTTQGGTHAMPGTGNGARFTGIEWIIPNYTSGSYNKAMHSQGGYGASTTQAFLNLVSYNNLNNTSAVSSITFKAAGSGTFAVNSLVSLYGLS